MICPQNHEVDESANFCPTCGMPMRIPEGRREIQLPKMETELRSILHQPNSVEPSEIRRISRFGRNHAFIARAVADKVGDTLSSKALGALVMARFPEFNPGSLLFNDHAEGNKGACRCAGTEDAIFDKVARGAYTVRDLGIKSEVAQNPNLVTANSYNPLLDDMYRQDEQTFSNWLLYEAIEAIEFGMNKYGDFSYEFVESGFEVLSGGREGRYPSIGIKILGQQAWAVGCDTYYDFILDSPHRPTKRPYCGWRGGTTLSGSGREGRLLHQNLKTIFVGREWLPPDQWWSTYRELPFEGDSGQALLSGDDYRSFVVSSYCKSLNTLLTSIQASRELKEP